MRAFTKKDKKSIFLWKLSLKRNEFSLLFMPLTALFSVDLYTFLGTKTEVIRIV